MSKRSHEETMTEFWCRTNPDGDQHGIMYKADRQTGENEYICEGSRMIGDMNGKSVWVFGGYIDVMNTQGIKIIDDGNVTKLNDDETQEVLSNFNMDHPDLYHGYKDETSYWFYLKPPSSRRRTPGRTPGRTPARTPARTPRRTTSRNGGKRKSRKNRK